MLTRTNRLMHYLSATNRSRGPATRLFVATEQRGRLWAGARSGLYPSKLEFPEPIQAPDFEPKEVQHVGKCVE
jgi:hypothetical protein